MRKLSSFCCEIAHAFKCTYKVPSKKIPVTAIFYLWLIFETQIIGIGMHKMIMSVGAWTQPLTSESRSHMMKCYRTSFTPAFIRTVTWRVEIKGN